VAVGGIHNFQQAEAVLAEQQGDIVGLARQALADPDWFRKVRSGRQVTCELWDREDLGQSGIVLSTDRRRRLLPPDWTP
jgi:2,4-dienoyl-CoA reductase-like NADH-dependent reductase (Old Yellow Enzyme family)